MTAYQIDRAKWARFSTIEQMGNISSEVGRSLHAKSTGRTADSEAAVNRALDLFDATIDCLVTRRSPRLKEVLRAKDQYLHAIFDVNSTANEADKIDRYFSQFAVAARMLRR